MVCLFTGQSGRPVAAVLCRARDGSFSGVARPADRRCSPVRARIGVVCHGRQERTGSSRRNGCGPVVGRRQTTAGALTGGHFFAFQQTVEPAPDRGRSNGPVHTRAGPWPKAVGFEIITNCHGLMIRHDFLRYFVHSARSNICSKMQHRCNWSLFQLDEIHLSPMPLAAGRKKLPVR